MPIQPIPILTKILCEEAQQVCTPEIREMIWQKICDLLAKGNGYAEITN